MRMRRTDTVRAPLESARAALIRAVPERSDGRPMRRDDRPSVVTVGTGPARRVPTAPPLFPKAHIGESPKTALFRPSLCRCRRATADGRITIEV